MAFAKDDEGRTAFDILCMRGFDDLTFLGNESFGGLMVWWYDCLGIELFSEGTN